MLLVNYLSNEIYNYVLHIFCSFKYMYFLESSIVIHSRDVECRLLENLERLLEVTFPSPQTHSREVSHGVGVWDVGVLTPLKTEIASVGYHVFDSLQKKSVLVELKKIV